MRPTACLNIYLKKFLGLLWWSQAGSLLHIKERMVSPGRCCRMCGHNMCPQSDLYVYVPPSSHKPVCFEYLILNTRIKYPYSVTFLTPVLWNRLHKNVTFPHWMFFPHPCAGMRCIYMMNNIYYALCTHAIGLTGSHLFFKRTEDWLCLTAVMITSI